MQDDFIRRQDAIDALGEEPEVWSGNDEYEQGLNNQWHYDVNALKALLSADVVERKKGEWIPANSIGDCCYKCSICGYIYDAYSFRTHNFCPNCGADMRGGDAE